MDIFLTSDNHLFFWGGNWQYFLQKWPVCFFQDNRRKLCQSSSEQISDIGELAKWWFSKIYFRSDNHLCFFVEEMGSFLSSVAHQPWPLCLFQDNQRKLCESSSEQMRSNHRFGRTIREHCSLNTLFIKCVHCAVYNHSWALFTALYSKHSLLYSVFTGHCKMYSTVCIDHPWTLLTDHT